MKSLMQLWKRVLYELGTQIGVCTTVDGKTANSRFEHEGLSFLTITLSDFGSDFQKSLDRESIDPDLFSSWKKRGKTPLFLGGFLDLVFDRESGQLLPYPNVDAIFAIRQLTLMMSKVRIDCTEQRVRKAINGYVQTEKEVREHDAKRTASDTRSFACMFATLFGDILNEINREIDRGELRPKHGPGATAERIRGNAKFDQTEWTERLEPFFPPEIFLIPGWKYFEQLERVTFLAPEQERPVRVVTVPKTLKTPRIIAIEPVAMQYCQQALLETFVEKLTRDDILGKLLGFDDQLPNQQMAQAGSIVKHLATLDLSEASDRVSNQLVRAALAPWPSVAGAVDACRSRKADVDGHGVIRLAKFASMGSALTFPIEAMVFLTIVCLAMEKQGMLPLGLRKLENFSQFRGLVRVYGDDIIVPTHLAQSVSQELETFGFRVNLDKSFWNGSFRESCGKEYWHGHDVSIVRVRSELPTGHRHASEIIATVALRNQLYQLGLWATCQSLDELLRKCLKGYYPVVAPTSGVLGRHSMLGYETQRMSPTLHSPLVKGYRVRTRLPKSKLDGEPALLKFLLKRGQKPLDKGHLERAGRSESVDLRLGWFSPF